MPINLTDFFTSFEKMNSSQEILFKLIPFSKSIFLGIVLFGIKAVIKRNTFKSSISVTVKKKFIFSCSMNSNFSKNHTKHKKHHSLFILQKESLMNKYNKEKINE